MLNTSNRITANVVSVMIQDHYDDIVKIRHEKPGKDGQHIVIIYQSIDALNNYIDNVKNVNFTTLQHIMLSQELPIYPEFIRSYPAVMQAISDESVTCISTALVGDENKIFYLSSTCIKFLPNM